MSKSLFSVTPDPLTGGGIFSSLQSLEPPWAEEDIALHLDLAYYGNVSGGKVVSPLIDRLLTASKLTTLDMATLAGVLMATNKERWSREWATRSAQYDPIKNYDMTEEMTDDETVTDYGHTRTRTDNLTHTTTPNLTEQTSGDVYGFNSSNAVHSDKQVGTTTGTSTDLDTGTQTDADTGSDTSTRNYTLTRSGNIGVTTTQQMLQSERDLWMWSYFYDVVFPDVDEVLTVPVYADDTDEDDGRIIPKGTISIIENGTYDVKTYASASVNVPQPAGDVTITTNGTHNVTQYANAVVQVPNTYTEADEGKVVSSGALVSQTGPLEITENGTYNTILNSSVLVNVPEIPNIQGFELYFADNEGNTRSAEGTIDNEYFVCFFHDNMANVFTLNGTEYTFLSEPGYEIGAVKGATVPALNTDRGANAVFSDGSIFSVRHYDSGSYISVGGGWVGVPSGGEIKESLVTSQTNTVVMDDVYNTLLVFVGGSQRNSAITDITINGTAYTITSTGHKFDSVYGEYGAIILSNNVSDRVIVDFGATCYNYVSVIGVDL